MKKIIQVHIYRGDAYYVAECIDLPVVTQGRTLDELADNLREAIALHLEGEDLSALGLDKGTLGAIYRQALRYIPEGELRDHFYTK